jgi:hypothetical protein
MHKKNGYYLLFASILVQLSILIGVTDSAKGAGSMSADFQTAYSTPYYNPLTGPPYPIAQESYFTDDAGNILMFVNILGQVARPGQFIVRENADFATILALTGGLRDDANLSKVLVIRHEPDENGKQAYVVNLKSFYKKGDTSSFISLRPNDTIIFPEKAISISKIAQYASIVYPFVYFYDILDRNN